MTNTHFRDDFAEIVKHQAYGYTRQGGTFKLSVTNFDTAGATSLLTTAEDLAKWDANFQNPVVGGAALVAAMEARGRLNDGQRHRLRLGHRPRHASRTENDQSRWSGRRISFGAACAIPTALRRRDAVQPGADQPDAAGATRRRGVSRRPNAAGDDNRARCRGPKWRFRRRSCRPWPACTGTRVMRVRGRFVFEDGRLKNADGPRADDHVEVDRQPPLCAYESPSRTLIFEFESPDHRRSNQRRL